GGGGEVLGLLSFECAGASGPEILVKGAAVVGDEDDLAEVVFADEEGELFFEGGLLPEGGGGAAGEARCAARNRDAVVAGEDEAFVEKLVHLLAEASVAAVDGGRA